MTTVPCAQFIYPSLDDPRYYADMCHACGHFKRDHPEFSALCANCEKAPATENWGGTHDQVSLARNPSLIRRWCRRCVLMAQVAHLRAQAPMLEQVERELAELDATDGKPS